MRTSSRLEPVRELKCHCHLLLGERTNFPLALSEVQSQRMARPVNAVHHAPQRYILTLPFDAK
jgi:hypothetical protein